MSSSSSSSVRVVPSTSSEGTQSEGPEASVLGSSCSGIPSPADARSQRDLEVMMSCHNIASIISEEALESIRECHNIPEGYPRKPSEKSAPAAGPESTQPEVEVIYAETLAKRPIGSSVPDQAVRKDDEGYYVLQMVDWTPRDSSATMQAQSSSDPYGEPGVPTQGGDRETTDGRGSRAADRHSMKEQRADRRKADDKLLKLMRNESLKAELPGKSITDYKQSVRFPDLEVDNRPFTKQPEDRLPWVTAGLVTPMLVGNFMERWNVDTTALDLLRVGRPIIALYVEGRSTTMKMTISVLVRGSSPIVIGRVPAFFDIMVVFTMETIILTLVPFLGTDFDAIWRRQESFPPYLEENLGPRGVEGRCRRSCAAEV
ncbi:hypothetical protein BHM03_00034419 [Ensete ventricosum]|uniref:Uncharacterized protein n=1 Tax=Ensete ventricosum TaxID=4639 RepID=A0A445MJH1_ENSVE|nr:hypothetical protein BHM03_00034419 [Ensete ventricosum]